MRLPTRVMHQYPRSTTGLVLAGLCLSASIAVVVAYQPSIERLRQLATRHQQDLVHTLDARISQRFATSRQQALNLAGLVEDLPAGPERIEDTLMKLLSSSPPEDIYGMGVWFAPEAAHAFPNNLYGPYAHFDDARQLVLTRQWMSPSYNYPQQGWYRLIAAGQGELRCTPPYLDMGEVFLTCGKSFPAGAAAPRGLVTVDMVLPQLNQLLRTLSTPQQETVFLTYNGHLLAHPEAERLLAGKPPGSLLDLPADLPSREKANPENWQEYRLRLTHGWEAHVISRKSWLHRELGVVYQRMALWLALIWLAGVVIDAIWLYTTRDIRTALNRNLSLRNALSDAVPSGVFLCDEEQIIVWGNPVFFRLTGGSAANTPLADLLEPEDRPGLDALWQQALDSGVAVSGEFRLAHDPDSWVQVRLVRVHPDESHGSGMAGTIDDITVRRHSEEALRLARDEAERASRAKGDFLATMSHEIRTPMNGVIGMANLLQETPLSPEQAEYARTLQSSAGTLLKIINDILDLSRIEAGKFPIEHHPFRLRDLISELLALLQPIAAQKDIDLDSGLPSDLPEVVIGDADRVKQILLNLLGNAIKFTETGSVTLSITVSDLTADSVRLGFHVIDTGIGLSLEQQSRIFTPFTQADSSTTRRYGGTGLGLTICRRLVSLMGGEIHCYSEPEQGAHFWFDLSFPLPQTGGITPLATGDLPPRALRADARVLVVEDNPVNLQVVQAMLKRLGLKADFAHNGEEALALLTGGPVWDLVLMDCQMPVLDGFETTRRWRAIERGQGLPRLPIVALTANAMRGDTERCLDAGMDAYLSKPVTISALTATLSQWLAA